MDISKLKEIGTISITTDQIQSIVKYCKYMPFDEWIPMPQTKVGWYSSGTAKDKYDMVLLFNHYDVNTNKNLQQFITLNDRIIQNHFHYLKRCGLFWCISSSGVPWMTAYMIVYLYSKNIIEPSKPENELDRVTIKRIVPDDQLLLRFAENIF